MLAVTLGKLHSKGELADLGASIILMLISIVKQLDFELKPSNKTIQFIVQSIKMPCGAFEDLRIQVEKIVVPLEFFVLDMVEDPYTPLILGGRCFEHPGCPD